MALAMRARRLLLLHHLPVRRSPCPRPLDTTINPRPTYACSSSSAQPFLVGARAFARAPQSKQDDAEESDDDGLRSGSDGTGVFSDNRPPLSFKGPPPPRPPLEVDEEGYIDADELMARNNAEELPLEPMDPPDPNDYFASNRVDPSFFDEDD